MQKKTILLLGPLPPPYIGPAIATELLLRSDLGKRYRLLHLNNGIHRSVVTLGSISLRSVAKNLAITARLIPLLLRTRPALVLVPISQTTGGFVKDSIHILISRLLRRHVLLQLRGSDFQNWLSRSPGMIRSYVHFILGKTEGVIVLGEKLRSLFAPFFTSERIHVVPNGLDLEPASAPRDGRQVRLLYLGNLQPEKGILDVMDALVRLRGMGMRAPLRLDLMGSWRDGATRDRCFDAIRRFDLPVHLHFPCKDERKSSLLGAADILVFTPNEPEGHPWVIVEAMAAGLPIISTDQGAIAESVIDGVNGFIVGSKAPEQIAEKVKLLVENPGIRRSMGRESRKLYEERFTELRMVERLSAAIEKTLAMRCAE